MKTFIVNVGPYTHPVRADDAYVDKDTREIRFNVGEGENRRRCGTFQNWDGFYEAGTPDAGS